MRVAIVHDWLTGMRGGERCLLAFLAMYPDADIHTLLHVPGTTSPVIDARVVQTSVLQSFPAVKRLYRHYLPLYPLAARSLTIDGYDLVISLSHAAAKNVRVSPGTRHISYCFTPMRYIWDQAEAYFGRKTVLLAPLLGALRRWDVAGSRRVNEFVAISRFVAERISRCYDRNAEVIYPPVDASWIESDTSGTPGEAFLYAGAFVPYKKADVVIEAFNALKDPLWVVGGGPLERELKRRAKKNITFLGRLPDAELGKLYKRCRALVFPGVEDFGLVPVECMAAGRPVIALGEGGVTETVNGIRSWNNSSLDASDPTGVFYRSIGESSEALVLASAVQYFIKLERDFRPSACIERAAKFRPEVFFSDWHSFAHGELVERERAG